MTVVLPTGGKGPFQRRLRLSHAPARVHGRVRIRRHRRRAGCIGQLRSGRISIFRDLLDLHLVPIASRERQTESQQRAASQQARPIDLQTVSHVSPLSYRDCRFLHVILCQLLN